MTPDPTELVTQLQKENRALQKRVARAERNMKELQSLSDNHARLLKGVMLELEKEKDRLERALSDLKEAQQRLVQAEKMASLGQLTAGIAHEMRNPLNFVNNFADVSMLLCEELQAALDEEGAAHHELLDDLRENLERIHRNGRRAVEIVGGMLELASPAGRKPAPTDINDLVVEAYRVAYRNLRSDLPPEEGIEIRFEKDLAENLAQIEVVRTDLGRVLINLYNNAFDALTSRVDEDGDSFGPTVRVTTRRRDGYTEIEVCDNGSGIPEEIRSKVFDPFFTTKKGTAGTGLGLAVSYDIVAGRHGGQIELVAGDKGRTTFRIRLPNQRWS